MIEFLSHLVMIWFVDGKGKNFYSEFVGNEELFRCRKPKCVAKHIF